MYIYEFRTFHFKILTCLVKLYNITLLGIVKKFHSKFVPCVKHTFTKKKLTPLLRDDLNCVPFSVRVISKFSGFECLKKIFSGRQIY